MRVGGRWLCRAGSGELWRDVAGSDGLWRATLAGFGGLWRVLAGSGGFQLVLMHSRSGSNKHALHIYQQAKNSPVRKYVVLFVFLLDFIVFGFV